MIAFVTWAVVALCTVTVIVAGIYARSDRLMDDWLLGLVAVVEAAVVVQVVRGLTDLSHVANDSERLTLVAYLVSLPVVPVGTAFLAIKEKSRWSMAAIAVGAFAVAVMMLRCQQIWDTPYA